MNITFVIGGARSGKSGFALNEAAKADGKKAYIATAEALDDEMKDRIKKHQIERDSDWHTYEEQIKVYDVLMEIKDTYAAALLDCLTIWVSNVLLRAQVAEPGHKLPEEIIDDFAEKLNGLKGVQGARLFIVSNEVGMGIVPENKLARQFRDLAGTLNQKVAGIADDVYLVAAGIPVKIK